jgi:hypothetical protein
MRVAASMKHPPVCKLTSSNIAMNESNCIRDVNANTYCERDWRGAPIEYYSAAKSAWAGKRPIETGIDVDSTAELSLQY